MRKKMFVAFMTLPAILLGLLAGGCGSGNKEGQSEPVANPTATGNIQAQILSVSIASPPVVKFTLADENGAPLDPAAVLAAGGRVRFAIGRIESDNNYRNYCNGSSTTTGVPDYDRRSPAASHFATVSPGVYTYTFYTDIDNTSQTLGGIVMTGNRDKTHTVAAQIQRDSTTFTGKPFQQAANPYLNFRPDGGAVTKTREVVSISACNVCHKVLGLHGGGRREIALCILCHNPGGFDPTTGNSIDLKSLVHKIHMGLKLPSNQSGGDFTIGTSDSFKTVEFPLMSGDNVVTHTPIKCVKCHVRGTNTVGMPYGADVDRWKAAPTKTKCTTCHDTMTFNGETSITVLDNTNPVVVDQPRVTRGGPGLVRHDLLAGQTIDVTGAGADNTALCSSCHDVPGFENAEYNYASVPGDHTLLEESSINTGIHFQIVSVDNGIAGRKPIVRFRVTSDNGDVIAPATGSFNLKLGYPAADYNNFGNTPQQGTQGQPFTKSLTGATANGDGSYTATFDNTIPASATGVGVIGMEGRKGYSLTGFRTGEPQRNIGGPSVQYYFDMATGAQVTDPSRTRRRIVDINKCLKCHERLSLHGANRVNNPQECVICHNAAAFNPAEGGTIDFKVFIHQIHTGEDLDPSQPVFGGADFREVRYPQDRRNCLACHLDATPPTFGIPLAAGVQGTSTSWGLDNTTNADDPKTPPMQAVCTACHGDQTFTAPHVANQTTGTTELCAQCHTTGLLLGPDFAHEAVR